MERKPFIKINLKPTKTFYITFVLVYFFVILCECSLLPFSRQGFSIISLLFIFFSFVRLELRENPVTAFILATLSSFAFTVLMQILVGADPRLLNDVTLLGNVALNVALTYLLLLIFNRIKWALIVSNTALFIFAFIEYMVISFRGSEIKISDFYSLRTAASVVGQYKIEFTSKVNYSILLFLLFIFVVSITKFTHKSKKSQLPRLAGAIFLGLSLFTVSWCMNNSTNYMQLWAFDGTKYNGLTYNFLIEARDSRVKVPEGYSDERAEEILSAYTGTESKEDTPHVIVIMSEAFSDLSILGDFNTSEDPLEYYHSLDEDITKGYALSSVYGGNTAVSEWEFLTGNTQAFLPYGSVAYQQYIKKSADSIVDIMNENGYTTISMHPYRATGWKRDVIYEIFGFDEIYFEEELSKDKKIRGLVSDETLFSDIIKRFENKKENEKIFNFCITMQNHGGYEYGNFPSEVTVSGIDVLSANQYLTLMNKSDDALKNLISYFENYDEKTMIVFFGDHFPSLNRDFYTYVMGDRSTTFEGTMEKHKVPFFIWTNYDTPEEEVELTSLNFLPVLMLKKAGIGLTPYFSYLDALSEKIPAINFYGYNTVTDRKIRRVSEAQGEEYDLINEYRVLQYKNLFRR